MTLEKGFEEPKKTVAEAERNIVGDAYKEPISLVKKYAVAKDIKERPLLFVGERGVGKELFANLFIATNPRKGKILKDSCARHPDTLIDSYFFGAKAGAYTDLKSDLKGAVLEYKDGFIFLDELGKAPTVFQYKLTRFLEYQTYTREGDATTYKGDIQFLGATNDLGAIKQDLQDRFRIVFIPPLWAPDIPLLAQHFFENRRLKKEILQDLMAREFPGNVRELKGVCNDLEALRGKIIFDKNEEIDLIKKIFDYDRFAREFGLWLKYIQPLVDRYTLPFRYKFFPLPKETVKNDAIPYDPAMNAWALLIGRSRWETHDFCVHLDGLFKARNLTGLFDKLAPQPKATEYREWNTELAILVDCKYNDAMKGFESLYFAHHLKMHPTQEETAKAIGLPYGTLKGRIKKLQK